MRRSARELQIARNVLKKSIRNFFESRNYIEVETPILVPCPGTELHLNYFQSHWLDYQGKLHETFLRSSPELHMKQYLADSGDRIFQFAKCFRNGGELSNWHHPEFTMLEWYCPGISYDAFMQETVDLLRFTVQDFKKQGISHIEIPVEVAKMTVYEAFERFARIELVDGDNSLAAKARKQGNRSVQEHDDFETAYFKILLDSVEPEIEKLGMVLLYDFPPSQAALAKVVGGRAKRFEIYFNRVELCNAFWELTDPTENVRRIQQSHVMRMQSGKATPGIDDGFIRAIQKGIPESCGNALGFDRWLALILGDSSISDVVPFRSGKPYSTLIQSVDPD